MGPNNSKQDISKSSAGTASSTKSLSDAMQPRSRMTQNYLVIWVDSNIDPTNKDCKNSLEQLHAIVNDVNLCATLAECIEFLNEIDDRKAFIISSGALGQQLVANIHDIPKVDAIYIFCGNQALHEQWIKEWPKIRGVFTSIHLICESLRKVARECDHDAIPMSFVSRQMMADGAVASDQKNLDQLPPSYMYSVIFKDIILEINDDDAKCMKTLVIYCQQKHIPETEINEFKCMYHQKSPVWWYTKEMFLYGMLNRALRSLDMEAMTKLGFFIRSLHLQLKQLHQEQSANFNKSFTVYRGQGLTQEDFQNLSDSKGGLLSFNNFLSTSKRREVAMRFVRDTLYKNNNTVDVMFIMTIDPNKISTETTPFAMIDDYTAVQEEEEILFTMHTVLRVGEIKQAVDNKRLWEVQLSITGDNDLQLATLTDRIKEEVQDANGWFRMGKLMLKVGHFNQAEALHDELLKNASSDTDRAHIFHQLGKLKDNQGKYQEAVTYYEKSLKIREKSLPPNHPDLAQCYNDIGIVYNHMGGYSKALKFYEKSLKIREKFLPPNHPDLAESYNNIGLVYNNMSEYSKAFEFYEKSIEIKEISLPLNHPGLGTTYSNMGQVYNSVGNYSKALEFYEKDLEIKKKTLPPTHTLLATSYNNIGAVYGNMGNYSNAREFYEKSYKIWEISLPPTHPSLATSSSNIGQVYLNMGDYSKALEFYEKSLRIREISLPPTHPDLANSYSRIGGVYLKMGDYSKALEFYEKSLRIREISLPPTHPDLATSYSHIGEVYLKMSDYSKALAFYESSLEIGEKSLPPTHPNLATSYHQIGLLHNSMGGYSKALPLLEKALAIFQNSLPSTHQNIKLAMKNIEVVRKNLEGEDEEDDESEGEDDNESEEEDEDEDQQVDEDEDQQVDEDEDDDEDQEADQDEDENEDQEAVEDE